ncbi:MAG: hypothetical protein WCV88_02085 [Patescibacteria group bacterium]|jgi:hypothetical protein
MYDDNDPNITWQDRWEGGAREERVHYQQMTPDQLLQCLNQHDFGSYYSLWYVIGTQTTQADKFIWPLYDVIASSADFLTRYHAATNLAKLLNWPDDHSIIKQIKLSQERPTVELVSSLKEVLTQIPK